MKILIMGGTGDARQLALQLHQLEYDITYSIAGIVRKTPLPCTVLTGGFSHYQHQGYRQGAIGLYWHLKQHDYDLVIDATHPYSTQISQNIIQATSRSHTRLWRFHRKPWQKTVQDQWFEHPHLKDIIYAIQDFKNPFFTAGREVFDLIAQRLPQQTWLVRTAGIYTINQPNIIELKEIGPYNIQDEIDLFKRYNVDALISKNSGGSAVAAKLEAARFLHLPVFLLQRPALDPSIKTFTQRQLLIDALS